LVNLLNCLQTALLAQDLLALLDPAARSACRCLISLLPLHIEHPGANFIVIERLWSLLQHVLAVSLLASLIHKLSVTHH